MSGLILRKELTPEQYVKANKGMCIVLACGCIASYVIGMIKSIIVYSQGNSEAFSQGGLIWQPSWLVSMHLIRQSLFCINLVSRIEKLL